MSAAQRPTRRAFLQGRAAVESLASAVTGWDGRDAAHRVAGHSPTLPGKTPAAELVTSIRRRAMACEFEVQLAAGRQDGSMERMLEALDLVEALEAQLTVYRAGSEVLRINRAAASGPVSVEPRLFAVFQLAERLYRETGGAFDLTTGPLSEVWGFSRREGRLPSGAEIAAARSRVGMGDVVLDAEERTIAFRQPGLSLHLNSIGKGYALDRMAELLDANDVGDYLLHGGRSSIFARGKCPGGARSGWTIGVPNPLRPGERLAEIDLVDQSLGTSGSGTQFFEHGGRHFGHLLDPRTGRPVEGINSATVVAPTAAEADALSTAFYVMGVEEVGRYCAKRPEIAALLITPSDRAGDAEVTAFGFDENQLRLTADESRRSPP